MSYTNIIVDHMKLEYKGPFVLKDLFRLNDSWLFERGFEKRTNKNFELETSKGKFIEFDTGSWKKVSDYIRAVFNIRFLIYEINKVEVVKDGKKEQMDYGKVIVYLDGYLEFDYEHRWDGGPLLVFIRTLYDKFIYSAYTDRFEQRFTMDIHQYYDHVEKFFAMNRAYNVVSKPMLFK